MADKQDKPNFIFFLIDDLGYKDLGCYGSKFYETPNVDKLAAHGWTPVAEARGYR